MDSSRHHVVVLNPVMAEAGELLRAERRRRAAEITELEVHLQAMYATIGLASGDGSRLADVELLGNQLASARRALDEVDAALGRVANGSYGTCADCGRPIAAERLEVLPAARLCTPCQSAQTSWHR